MQVVCPNCGANGQEPGKYCENCGYLIPADAGQSPPPAQPVASPPPPSQPAVTLGAGVASGLDSGLTAGHTVGAQFAVVRDGQASLSEGFTLSRAGEFLVGRMDQESGTQVDVDLRQWVQPIDIRGEKQYLVHRKQCYIGVGADSTVTLRPWPGVETDTLVRASGQSTFTNLKNLAAATPPQPDGSFPLNVGDQIYMGDPDAVMYFMSGDPTAQDNYLVLQLINKS